jgi:hypothetical protein
MTDPTGFVPPAAPFQLAVPDRGAPPAADPTGFVPTGSPFVLVVPDRPAPPEPPDGRGR